MYGLLLENMKAFIIEAFGEKKWNEVRDSLKLKDETFGLKDTFPEGRLLSAPDLKGAALHLALHLKKATGAPARAPISKWERTLKILLEKGGAP